MRRKTIAGVGGLVMVGLLLVLLGLFPVLVGQILGLQARKLAIVCDVMISVGLVLMFGLGAIGVWLVRKESNHFKGFGGPKKYGNKRTDG